MTDARDWNSGIIAEFRASAGKVGGQFEGAPLLLLTTTGRKSGRTFTSPVMYLADDGRLLVFGSKGGAPDHPDWYLNLVNNPAVTVEVGTETFPARAVVLEGEERDRDVRGTGPALPRLRGIPDQDRSRHPCHRPGARELRPAARGRALAVTR